MLDSESSTPENPLKGGFFIFTRIENTKQNKNL